MDDGEDREIIAIDKKDAERIMNASNPLSELIKVVQEYDIYKGEGIVNVKKSEGGDEDKGCKGKDCKDDTAKQTERRLNPVSVDAITKDDFDAYVAVQRSGKYNMIMDADAAADDADLDIDTYYGIIKNYGALVSKYGRKGESLSESLTLKQKELKNMARYGEATDITTISDAEAKELKKKGIETVGISRGAYGMNGALLRDNEGNKYVITARSSNLFYFV